MPLPPIPTAYCSVCRVGWGVTDGKLNAHPRKAADDEDSDQTSCVNGDRLRHCEGSGTVPKRIWSNDGAENVMPFILVHEPNPHL